MYEVDVIYLIFVLVVCMKCETKPSGYARLVFQVILSFKSKKLPFIFTRFVFHSSSVAFFGVFFRNTRVSINYFQKYGVTQFHL